MTDLILAAPWWLLALLVVVGGAVAYSGNRRADATTRNVGLGVVGLAVVLFVVGRFYETDVAKVRRLNGELVASVPAKDWSKMTDLLDDDATLGWLNETAFTTRAAIVAGAKADVDHWGVKSANITNTEVKQDAAGVTVDVTVVTQQDGAVPMTKSDWRMEWDRTGKEWHCHHIICLGIGGEKATDVGRYLK